MALPEVHAANMCNVSTPAFWEAMISGRKRGHSNARDMKRVVTTRRFARTRCTAWALGLSSALCTYRGRKWGRKRAKPRGFLSRADVTHWVMRSHASEASVARDERSSGSSPSVTVHRVSLLFQCACGR